MSVLLSPALPSEEIVTKFKNKASRSFDSTTADDLVSSIEQASSVRAVTAAMSGKLAARGLMLGRRAGNVLECAPPIRSPR
jgi:hypothetical protein